MKYKIIILILIFAISGCIENSSNNPLVGTWEYNGEYAKTTMTFTDDGLMIISPSLGGSFSYRIEENSLFIHSDQLGDEVVSFRMIDKNTSIIGGKLWQRKTGGDKYGN